MSADRRPGLKGWPKSWYVNENEDGDIRCPAVGCHEVFRTIEDLNDRTHHFYNPGQDPDTKFHHAILEAMDFTTQCPKCDEFEFSKVDKPYGAHDPRFLFKHEREKHHTEEFSDIKKFIGLIRKYRKDPYFVHDVSIWRDLHEYYIRNIQKQPEFEEFKKYLSHCDINTKLPPEKYLEEVAKRDRGSEIPVAMGHGMPTVEVTWFPVHRDQFLKSFPCPKDQEGDAANIRDIMRAKYARGEF